MNFSKKEIELLTKQNLTIKDWFEFFGNSHNNNSHSNNYVDNYIDYSYSYCKSIALGHYENFPVASIILPQKYKKHIFAVYAFSRLADDIADDCPFWDKEIKIEKLNNLIELIRRNLSNKNNDFFHPILSSVIYTINEFELEISLFERLINAFKYDADFREFDTFENVINYCDNSANPIGEIILNIFGEINKYNPSNQNRYNLVIEKSNALCTALQLVNFWQDFSRDKVNNRFYVSNDILNKYNSNLEKFYYSDLNNAKKELILKDIYKKTEYFFENSKDLFNFIDSKRLSFELLLIYYSGYRTFSKVQDLNEDIINFRPKLTKKDLIYVFRKSIANYFKYKLIAQLHKNK